MKHKPKHKTDQRAAALKANLARRKEQAREKQAGTDDKPVDGCQ